MSKMYLFLLRQRHDPTGVQLERRRIDADRRPERADDGDDLRRRQTTPRQLPRQWRAATRGWRARGAVGRTGNASSCSLAHRAVQRQPTTKESERQAAVWCECERERAHYSEQQARIELNAQRSTNLIAIFGSV